MILPRVMARVSTGIAQQPRAQSPRARSIARLARRWTGTLVLGRELRGVVHVGTAGRRAGGHLV